MGVGAPQDRPGSKNFENFFFIAFSQFTEIFFFFFFSFYVFIIINIFCESISIFFCYVYHDWYVSYCDLTESLHF